MSNKENSEKMLSMINLALTNSIDANKGEINFVLKTATDWEFFFWNSCFDIHHYKQITRKFENYAQNIPKHEAQSIALTLQYDTTMLVFCDLWRELGLAIRELISSNYEAVSRSLRWIIEATIVWAETQLDNPTASDIYTEIFSKKLSKKEYQRKLLEIFAVNKARFSERLRFKEKYGIVKISDTVDKIKIFKNRKKGEQKNLLRDKIVRLNSEFSTYAHCTVQSLEELDKNRRYDFAIYQGYEYNQESFNDGLNDIYQTIDVCLTIILLVNTEFYGYENPLKFMENIKSGGESLAQDAFQQKEKFPFLNNILILPIEKRKKGHKAIENSKTSFDNSKIEKDEKSKKATESL